MTSYRRQNDPFGDPNFPDDDGNWWFSPTGEAVRYAIVAVLFGAVLLYIVLGYAHARRRLRANLPPLAYHRWMVRRSEYSNPANVAYSQHHAYPNAPLGYQQVYPMQEFPPPPPAYNPAEAPPPAYQPPNGASKVIADQSYTGPSVRAGEGSASAAEPGSEPATRL